MAAPNQYTAPSPIAVLLRQQDLTSEQVQRYGATTALRSYRVKRHAPCPVCGEGDECLVIPEHAPGDTTSPITREHVWCVRNKEAGGVAGVEGEKGSYRTTWYFLRNRETGESARPRHQACQQDIRLAPASTIQAVLGIASQDTPLSDAHREKLAARGYPAEECGPGKRFAFSSLPAEEAGRYYLASTIFNKTPASVKYQDLLGVSGFSRDGRERYAMIGFLTEKHRDGRLSGSALIEWVRNETQAIIGFQYAPDVPPTDAKGKPKKRFSPLRQPSGDIYHVAYPAQETVTADLWYTEGVHKANLTAWYQGVIALASLGAGVWRSMLKPCERLDAPKLRRHVVALDADKWGTSAEVGLARELTTRGYRVVLARWDAALGNGPDDALVAGAAITFVPFMDPERTKGFKSITHPYSWQRGQETAEERRAKLLAASEEIAAKVRSHLEQEDRTHLRIIASPPGTGKTYSVSQLGVEAFDLAWVAERHDMAESAPALAQYHHIRPPDETNCPYHQLHRILAEKGYNTGIIHKDEPGGPCAYIEQFEEVGSTFFQVELVGTSYPARHQAILIDEFTPARWMPERVITLSRLQAGMRYYPTESEADLLSRTIQAVLTDASQEWHQAKHEKREANLPQGKALFDAIDRYANGRFHGWLGAIHRQGLAGDARPKVGLDLTDPDAAQRQASRLPPVILAPLWHALANEVARWENSKLPGGKEWNSCLRIGAVPCGPDQSRTEMALIITEPRHVQPEKPGVPLPPMILLDATADPELVSRLFGKQAPCFRKEIDPPPHFQHIAVRTGKRYGKLAHERSATTMRRTIAECRFLLERLNPDGSKKVGLITFMDIEGELGQALGLPAEQTGHFWAMRGSNRLETCDILLLVGTPTPPPQEVARLARAFYRDDLAPIDPACERAEDGTLHYTDPRMQRVADWLIAGELAQCAARNRAIRRDGKVVVSFCTGDIPFLPATETIISLPTLTRQGKAETEAARVEAEQRLARAYAELREQGQPITRRTLAKQARVRAAVATEWLRKRKESDQEPTEDIFTSVPETLLEYPYRVSGTNTEIPLQSSPPDPSASGETPGPSIDGAPPVPVEVWAAKDESLPPAPCLIASHQGFWRWSAGAWRCILCAHPDGTWVG